MSIRKFARLIRKTKASSKARLPWAKLARFGDDPNDKNCLRYNDNVLGIDGIEVDYDGEELSVAWALAKLDDAGIAGVVSTSASHTPGAPRWRVFCPTDRTLPPSERERLVARLNGVLGGKLAPESFNLSLSYYFGGVIGRDAIRVEEVDGRPINRADDLDAGALGRNGKPYHHREAANDDYDDDNGKALTESELGLGPINRIHKPSPL